ncbi:hypothetical protein [Actinoplanes rectilineatus]|uniref:hypothetical protein n=1 Tax=Actinoplanes rectilineatus TaxID=113571 RepID=UPI000AFE3245|nr:hypothetical protein [Actinoplanes rectilineatus]
MQKIPPLKISVNQSLRRCGVIAAGTVVVLTGAGAAVTDESSRYELMAYSLGSALTLYLAVRIIVKLRWMILQALAVLAFAGLVYAALKSLIGIVGLTG